LLIGADWFDLCAEMPPPVQRNEDEAQIPVTDEPREREALQNCHSANAAI
jgi:hypothetical protein